MAKIADAPKNQHLPQFVGYREVQAALGVSRRTVERMVRTGGFPRPVQLAPNRVGWQVETLKEWLAERAGSLVTHAVAHAEDLEPDQLEDQALDLVVKSMEKRTGRAIDAADLTVHVSCRVTEEELRTAEHEEFARYSERFEDLEVFRAVVLVAWLFPTLRPMFEGDDEAFQRILLDPAAIEALGRRALHDDSWAVARDQWHEMRRSGKAN